MERQQKEILKRMSLLKFKFIDKDEYLNRIEEFQSLFKDCFNRDITKEFLIWRYINNPLDEMFVNVAIENNKVIANYSVSPFRLSINGKLEKAALSMTTMTHPDFRGRGLFTELASGLYEKLEKSNYGAVIGFPNNNSHFTFVSKLNWQNIYEIPTMKLELSKSRVFNSDSKFHIINDKDFLLDYFKVISNNKKIKVYKSLAYLKWRYRDNPVNKYDNYVIAKSGEVLSSIIVKSFNNCEIDIVEINSLDNSYTKQLITYIIRNARNENVKYINMWCPLNDEIHLTAEKLGFLNHEPISYFGVKNFKIALANITDYNNWHIQMGDSDVY